MQNRTKNTHRRGCQATQRRIFCPTLRGEPQSIIQPAMLHLLCLYTCVLMLLSGFDTKFRFATIFFQALQIFNR